MAMLRQRSSFPLAGLVSLVLLALLPTAATAMSGVSGNLSQRLALLAQPAVRSAPHADQAARLGLSQQGPGSLLRRGNRILAYVRFERGAVAGVGSLRARGAEILRVSRRYQSVTVAVRPTRLRSLARAPRVTAVTEALAPVAAEACPSGDVVSEGVGQLHAGDETGEARDLFGVDGSGVTVGILSDSFDLATEAADGSELATKAADDVASGDLPGEENPCGHTDDVDVLEEEQEVEAVEPPVDEGRGMAQIVHDVAPGAAIAFASAFNGEDVFAANIGELANAGADVIVDDVFYFEEPFFQDGPVAVAATEAVEKDDVTYLSAAGNSNLFDAEGHEIASWETPLFRDAGSCPPEVQGLAGFNGTHCLDFAPGSQVDRTLGIRVAPGDTLIVDLQWDEPWEGVDTDLDAFLLSANGTLVTGSAEDNVEVSQRPLELVGWENTSSSERTVQLVINRFSGASPRLKLGLLANGSGVTAIEYPRSTGADVVGPTIFGHSGAASAISVGAIRFNKLTEPERYSSRGPVRHDYGPVTGPKAAKPLASPEILSKPDIIATDCGATTFFAGFTGVAWRFCGTSAAAPHAGGVAALMLESEPGEPPAGVRSALQASAAEVGAFGPCAVGAGLVEAVGALEELPSPGTFSPPECSPPSSEGSPEEARAPGDWGSEVPPPAPTASSIPASGLPAVRPRTFFRQRPPRTIRTRAPRAKAVFRFGSDQPEATFACRIDGAPFRPCPQRLVRRFPIGPHAIRVFARDAAGNADRTPAVYRFRVKRVG